MVEDSDSTPFEGTFALKRDLSIGFHPRQADTWLRASLGGTNTTPLAYAAFELRLALERIAVEFLIRIRGDELAEDDVVAMRSFKSVERRIYDLAGHQRQLDRTIQFNNCYLRAAGAKVQLAAINLGKLSRYWHACSELCHVESTFAFVNVASGFAQHAHAELTEVLAYVTEIQEALISWGLIKEPWFLQLKDAFVAGTIGEDEVLAKLTETGIYGIVTSPTGEKSFLTDFEIPRS